MTLREQLEAEVARLEKTANDLQAEYPGPWRTEWFEVKRGLWGYAVVDNIGSIVTGEMYEVATHEPGGAMDRANQNTRHLDWVRGHDPVNQLNQVAFYQWWLAHHDIGMLHEGDWDPACRAGEPCGPLRRFAAALGIRPQPRLLPGGTYLARDDQ